MMPSRSPSMSALPGSSGFVFELFALAGAFLANAGTGVLACLAGLVGAVGLYRLYRKVIFGPIEVEANRGLMDLDWRERALVVVLLLPILGLGLFPNPALRRIEPSVLEVTRHIASGAGSEAATEAAAGSAR